MDIAILLDGDFARRLIGKKLGHSPSTGELEAFCLSVVQSDERLVKTYYYDSPPFDGKRPLPVSQAQFNFSFTEVHAKALQFQREILNNPFFIYRRGHLSFDGWTIKEKVIANLIEHPRPLTDADFKPILSQKQVDMKIGIDFAKISIKKIAQRILLATSDADFIPAIHFARGFGLEVVLLSDIEFVKRTKGRLLKAFNAHRLV